MIGHEIAARRSHTDPTAPNPAWLARGERRFEFLRAHGLLKTHRLLEIGCGDLVDGWRVIRFLRPGAYAGVEISPEALLQANEAIHDLNLQPLEPRLWLVSSLDLRTLPASSFDVVDAPALLRRLPADLIDELFGGVRRVLRRDGFFDVTFAEAETRSWDVRGDRFHHPAEVIIGLAEKHGFVAERLAEWPLDGTRLRLRLKPRTV